MLLALNCQRQDLHFHEKLIFIFLFTSAWTRPWSWSCSWRPRSPAQWRCSGPRTARKRSTWRWTDTRTHWVGDKLINVESYKIVIVLLYIHIPVISELVETTEGPLVQVEQQSWPHTLKHVGRDVTLQVLSLHCVETVPHPNVTPILIPSNMAEWATLNLGFKVTNTKKTQKVVMYQKVQECVKTAVSTSRRPTQLLVIGLQIFSREFLCYATIKLLTWGK